MRFSAVSALSLLALALLSLACGKGAEPGLLGELPAGFDFYMTISPENAGAASVLEALGEAGLAGSPQLAAMGGALGIDPLSWDDWVSTMGLDPSGELALAGYLSDDGPSALAAFLPVSDSGALEGFVGGLPAEGSLQVSEWRDGWWAIYASDIPQQLDMLVSTAEEGDRLAESEDFDRMWSALGGQDASIHIYMRLHGEEELESMLVCAEEDGTVARAHIGVVPADPQAVQGLEVMARGPRGDVPGMPADVDIVMRSTVDMEAVVDMAEGEMPPDAEQGLRMMGFDSVEDMLDMFSGDSWAAVSLAGEDVRALAAIGLRDADQMEGFLSRLSGFAAMGGQEVATVSAGGSTGYSIPLAGAGGAWPLEIGVAGDALYLLYGYSLGDAVGWSSAPSSESALGVDHGAPAFASGDLSGLRGHLPESMDGFLPEAGRFAFSVESEGDMLVLRGALDTGEERPFSAIARSAFSLGIEAYRARVVPPGEVEQR